MTRMRREPGLDILTITSGQQTSNEAVDAREYAMFQILLPAVLTSTAITFTTSSKAGGTYQAFSDSTGAAVSITVAQGKNYDLPTALASSAFFKIVLGTAEGAGRTIEITKKG